MLGIGNHEPMHALLPSPSTGDRLDVDLEQAYAYPPERAWLRANMVCSVDGAASAAGRSQGLSSPADKRVFRTLRALADVIVVGAGTARAERYAAITPEETTPAERVTRGQTATAAIAVVSARLDLDLRSGLFAGAPTRSLVLTCSAADQGRLEALRDVAEVVVAGQDRVDLPAALNALAERGLARMLCEGGPALLSQIAAAGRLDELCLTITPLLTAGDAKRILTGTGLSPAQRLNLTHLLEQDGSLFAHYTREAVS